VADGSTSEASESERDVAGHLSEQTAQPSLESPIHPIDIWKRCAIVLAFVLPLFGLQVGLAIDDYFMVLRARGQFDGFASAWNLFDFVGRSEEGLHRLIELGFWPWWTWPALKLRFFRPLSSALIHFDVNVIGDHITLGHLHSIVWYLALVALVHAFYRRVVPAPAVGIALFFFVIDDTHVQAVAWLANRNAPRRSPTQPFSRSQSSKQKTVTRRRSASRRFAPSQR